MYFILIKGQTDMKPMSQQDWEEIRKEFQDLCK